VTPTRPERALLLDFFGTIVDYQPDRTQLGYPATFGLAQSLGFRQSRAEFMATWELSSTELEAASKRTLREFSMTDAAMAFSNLAELDLSADQCAHLGRCFVEEWRRHVRPIDGVAEMMHRLSTDWSIAIVSNTHDPAMVPEMLQEMGVETALSSVVLSVVHGRCKPHASIYVDTLDALAMEPSRVVFVGDNHLADYRGPEDVGIRSYLIDPLDQHTVPPDRRLRTVLDIESRLHHLDLG